jgi:hypothetical protein
LTFLYFHRYCVVTIRLIVPVYVSGGSAAEYDAKSIVNESVRDPEPDEVFCFATRTASGTPQFAWPVTIDDPFTRTDDAEIVAEFPGPPVIGPLM